MKRALVGAAALLAVLALFYLALAESAEVVVLETRDAGGASHETRLWVVDHDGVAWLRTGDPESPWLARVRAHPEVVVTRNGERRPFRATPVEDDTTRARINALTLEKYGWRESVLRAFGMGPEGTTPIRLEPR